MSANSNPFLVLHLCVLYAIHVYLYFSPLHNAQPHLTSTLFFEHNQNGLDQNSEVQSHVSTRGYTLYPVSTTSSKSVILLRTAYLPHSCHTPRALPDVRGDEDHTCPTHRLSADVFQPRLISPFSTLNELWETHRDSSREY